jgi:flagellar biogenesis protein FliO
MSHTGTLWQYLGSFLMYTLMTIGLIYGVFWYTRKAGGASAAVPKAEEAQGDALALESALPLEPNKTLYVVRSGSERFLISATGEGTQLLSRLESVPTPVAAEPVAVDPVEPKVDLPWYATVPSPTRMVTMPRRSFGQRFVQSVKWLVASRMR